MKTRMIITDPCWKTIQRHLLPSNSSDEQFGFGLTGISHTNDFYDIFLRTFIPASQPQLISQSGVNVKPDPTFTLGIWQIAQEVGSGIIDFHSHPFSNQHVSFSSIDDTSDSESFPKAVISLGPGPHASVVLGRNSVDARWFDPQTNSIKAIDEIRILTSPLTILIPTSAQSAIISADNDILTEVHNRQILAFGQLGQKALQRIKIAVVGCGGIGSVVIELLVRLGVKHICIIDPDVLETSNLNRVAGSTLRDARRNMPKVRMIERMAKKIAPDINITAIQKSISDEQTQEILKSYDILFGCTDNQSSRLTLNTLSAQYLIPYIDCGTGVKVDSNGRIEHAGGQVRFVVPGMGCLNCIGGIDLNIARQELLPELERQISIQQGYITGADVHAPTVASLNGVIANLAVTEFIAYVTGFKPIHRYIYYDLLAAKTTALNFDSNPRCFTCSPAGLLATGDHGQPMPLNLAADININSEGDNKMETRYEPIEFLINELLVASQNSQCAIVGIPEGGWFMLKDVKLGHLFSATSTDIIVKFHQDSRDPLVLIPEDLTLGPDGPVCSSFLSSPSYVKGWRPLCPHMIREVGNELFELVIYLNGILSNPSLCGMMGCDGKTVADPNQ